MQLISLFSGIGGFELAGEWAGWDNIVSCETNNFVRVALKYYWANSYHHKDIHTLDYETILKKSRWDPSKKTIIIGGFPCQPFSTAGKRGGGEDDRYLWPEMLRLINEIRPAWVCGENVAGITSMVQSYSEIKVENQTSLFEENTSVITEEAEYVIETICSDLEAIGYTVQPIIIPACAIGAPHRRDRIWFIAHNSNAGIEGVRSEREDSISGCKTTTDSNQCAERSSRASRKTESNGSKNNDEQKEWGEKTKQHIGCHDVLRTSTNSHNPQRTQQANEIQTRGNTVDDGGITNTNNEGLQRGTEGLKSKKRSKPIKEQSSRFNKLYAQEWENFPTESPIRTGDDGFSEILARITVLGKRGRRTLTKQQGYNRFCQESIKAFGNAVVPQIPYEIFKAINSQIKKED